jgi:nucleotide-binding universal stress UspA family protein
VPSQLARPHEHLFQPGHALAARHARARGWPATYIAVCVLCGAAVDLLAAPRRSEDLGPSPLVRMRERLKAQEIRREKTMRQTDGAVVVGYDGSTHAGAAVDWAATEASRLNKPLVVLYAADYAGMLVGVGGAGAWLPDEALDAAKEVAEEGARRARKIGTGVEVRAAAQVQSAAAALQQASGEATLIVVGTRGHGTVTGTLLGSVAFAVSAHAKCPVVVVRGDSSRAAGPGRPVVVGVDGSAQSRAALDRAADVAADLGAELKVVTAWQLLAEESWAAAYWAENYPGRNPADIVLEAATEVLEEARAHVLQRHPDLQVDVVAGEGPTVRVLSEASRGAGLLVVGARGRGGFASLLLGSVSRGMVHAAECPVEVIRPR